MKPSADRVARESRNFFEDLFLGPRQIPWVCFEARCGAYFMIDADMTQTKCPTCGSFDIQPVDNEGA